MFRFRALAGNQLTQTANDRFFGDQHGGANRPLIRDRLQDDLRTSSFNTELRRELPGVDLGAGKGSQLPDDLFQSPRPAGQAFRLRRFEWRRSVSYSVKLKKLFSRSNDEN